MICGGGPDTCHIYDADSNSWGANIPFPYETEVALGTVHTSTIGMTLLDNGKVLTCHNTQCFVYEDQCGCGTNPSCSSGTDTTQPVWSSWLVFSPDTYISYTANNAFSGNYITAWDYNGVAYSKVSGPSWIAVDSDSGELTGTAPGTTGDYALVVRAADPSGNFVDGNFKVEVKVLCTYYHSRGMVADNLMEGDLAYAMTVNPLIGRAYRAWANLLIGWLKKHEGSWADRFVYGMVQAWAKEMAYRTGYADEGSRLGWWLSEIGEPLHYLAGYFVPENDFERNLREQYERAHSTSNPTNEPVTNP